MATFLYLRIDLTVPDLYRTEQDKQPPLSHVEALVGMGVQTFTSVDQATSNLFSTLKFRVEHTVRFAGALMKISGTVESLGADQVLRTLCALSESPCKDFNEIVRVDFM